MTEEQRLLIFARRVLALMTKDKDWSASTMDLVSGYAIALDLATTDDDGFFKAVEKSQTKED